MVQLLVCLLAALAALATTNDYRTDDPPPLAKPRRELRRDLAVAAGESTAAQAGQRPPQVPGAFRSAITLVPLDVRVLDRGGRPVTGLTQDDFTILEDGVRQDIAHFSAQVLTPQPPPPEEAGPLLRQAPSHDMTPQQRRIFLILLGRGRLREPSHAMEALRHFVRERLLPQDLVAVFAWNRATDFTTDHEKVARVLERFDREHESIEGRLAFHFSTLAAAYGSKEIPAKIQADIDRVFSGALRLADEGESARSGQAGLSAEATGDRGAKADAPLPYRRVPPGAITDSRRMNEDAARVMGDLLSSGNDEMTDLPFEEWITENARTMQDLGNLYAGIEYLRFLEGEKHLVLVTEKGLFLPREEDDTRIAEAASNARVVIDTIETGGIYVGMSEGAIRGGPNPGQWSQWWAFTSLRTIAELTGGRSSVTEWTRVAVDRIDTSTRAGSLLGYYPKNTKWDGRYRKVTVKVARPGLSLFYRHGYEASEQLVPFDRQSFLTFNRMISAALYPEDLRDIRLNAGATLRKAGTGTGREIRVDVRIDTRRVTFATDEGLHVAHLDVAVFALDSRGRVTDERWQTIDLALKDDEYDEVRRRGIPYSLSLADKPATRDVKVVVYDYAGDVLGSTVVRVL